MGWGVGDTGTVDRRGFLLGATALLAAGCARVPPPGLAPTPGPTTTADPPLGIGRDGTRAGAVFTRVLVETLMAKGRNASTVLAGDDWRAALGHGDLAAMPGHAATVWASLSRGAGQPGASSLLGELAGLLAPEVSLLEVPGVDGRLVWVVTTATAETGVTSLGRIAAWSRGKVAAVPPLAVSRGDGVPGLKAVYGARFDVAKVEDPFERASRLRTGAAEIAAFRRTEYTGVSGLVTLADPEKLAIADPGVVLLGTAFTEAEPDRVLELNAAAQALTTEALVELQARVAAGGNEADMAKEWLRSQGLA